MDFFNFASQVNAMKAYETIIGTFHYTPKQCGLTV